MKTEFSIRCIQALVALAFSFTIAGIAWADDESTATKIAGAESAVPASISAEATIADVPDAVTADERIVSRGE
jgi:hypothetical protein